MKKSNLILYALLLCTHASAQEMKMYTDIAFDKFSPNGNWLVENTAGSMVVVNAENGKQYNIYDERGLDMYSPGLGTSVTNSGKICGFTMNEGAFIWDNGTMNSIEELSGYGTTFNGAQAFTPDENVIVGALGTDGAFLGADGLACYPVIWKKDTEGVYRCKPLPYLAKDFSGGTPQSVIATAVAADGRVAAGTLTSWNGFYTFPIVFIQDDSGNWEYKLLGKNNVYDESKLGELPEMPVEPVTPNYEDYMSEADKTAYENALQKYQDDLEAFNQGLTSVEPTYPTPDEYISDPEKKEQYVAIMQQYVTDHNAFIQAWKKYSSALDRITTGYKFTKNNICISANGKYLATSLVHEGITTPGYFDLTEEAPQFKPVTDDKYSMLMTGVLDDGTIFAASPVTELTRSSFVITKDAKTPVSFHDYLATRSETAAKWLADNNSYKVTDYENGEEVVKDSIISGTVGVSHDGNVFVSYYTDYYGDGNKKSFVIKLNESSGISNIHNDNIPLHAYMHGKTLTFSDNVCKSSAYDMSGRTVAKGGKSLSIPKAGIYIIKMYGDDNSCKSQKVIVE